MTQELESLDCRWVIFLTKVDLYLIFWTLFDRKNAHATLPPLNLVRRGALRDVSNGKGRELFELITKNMTLNIKSTIATIAILALVGLGVGVGASAAPTADVSATVTAELVSITSGDGTVAFGILPVDTNADTVTLGQTQSATNTGNVAVDLEVRSSDAVGGTGKSVV